MGNTLPPTYDSFLGSEFFTILAGPSLKPFNVHRQLLAEMSPELKGHVFNEMKEGLEKSMKMPHVSEETMCQFLEFCYTGTININHEEEIDERKAQSREDIRQKTAHRCVPALIPTVKLYVLGDMYNIPRLKARASKNIIAAIKEVGVEGCDIGWVAEAYIKLMRYVCDNLPEHPGDGVGSGDDIDLVDGIDPLLAFLAKIAAWGVLSFCDYKEFLELFSSHGRGDFTKIFLRRIEPGTFWGDPWEKPRPVVRASYRNT